MVHVREIRDRAELHAIRSDWSHLLSRTRGASFFHTWEWFEAYWRHFGDDITRQSLRVMVVERTSGDRSEVVGLLPLTVIRESTRVGTVRVLTYPLHDWGTFYGPLGADPAATISVVLAHVRRQPRDWDMLDLRWVDRDGTDGGATSEALARSGWRASTAVWKTTAWVDTRGDWGAYLADRSEKFRGNVKRLRRRLSERGPMRHVRYRPSGVTHGDNDPRWDLFDACVGLAQQSWQHDAGTGTTLSTTSIEPFLRELHAAAVELGALDLNLLMLDDRPVAYCYNYLWDGRITGVRSGYDRGQAHLSAGAVLMGLQIEDSFARGDRGIDLGPGYWEIKRSWATHRWESYRHTFYSWCAPRAQALRVKHWLNRLRHIAGDAAESRETCAKHSTG